MPTIFESLKALRKKAGLSQVEVAEKLSVTSRTIINCESGKRVNSVLLSAYAALFGKKVVKKVVKIYELAD